MKIPKTFLLEKKLDNKVEELMKEVPLQKPHKEEYREISLKELMRGNMRILHGNATDKQRVENIKNIASKIIRDTISGVIKWEEYIIPDSDFSKCYKTKATIFNYKQEPIIVPVTFLISDIPAGKWGDLYLGDDKGLCLRAFAGLEKIEQLLNKYFK